MPTGSLRIGTRGSALARWQAEHIQQLLGDRGAAAELVLIETQGDVKSGPIGAIGTQGVFTKEIQRALLDRRVDLAVHSLKDLPTEPVDGLQLTATPPREQCGDALVSNRFATFPELPAAARIGTGSARRQAQLLHWRSDLDVLDIRGNVDTRLQKLDDGEYDAIILAQAGLMRLGLADRIREVAPKEIILPAVGQGAIGLETRADDRDSIAVVSQLNDAETLAAVTAERSLLAALRGGCLAPVGAWARFENDLLHLDAVVLDPTGRERLYANSHGLPDAPVALGQVVAERLIADGAEQLIADSRI
ncbi:MAG: hydroxymethylbilane synthase [Pirellulaceae bacterium]|jgi:hydroxymethylbilane synthase|nr:hydroxymethylbilane synthase [Pirellulaceae bacterium]